MADTFTSGLRVRLQQTGANPNTWGQLLNAAAIQLLEDAVRGSSAITVAGTDVTLTTQNGADDQARKMVLVLGGAPGASRNVLVPALSKLYIVVNNTGFAQTVKTALGTGVAVPDGARQFLICDGTNVSAVQASTLGTVANSELLDGVDSTAFAQLAVFNEFTKGFATNFHTLSDGGTVTLDATLGNKFFLGIGGNRNLVISGAADGQELEIWIQQDGTGGRTITWPAEVNFEAGSSEALSTDADALDRFKLTFNEALGIFIASSALNAGGGATTNLAIEGTQLGLHVFSLLGEPAGAQTVNITLALGAVIFAPDAQTPALDFDGFDSGSVINLDSRFGWILGHGGDGGFGGSYQDVSDTQSNQRGATAGRAGGTSVRGPGTGCTFNITNAGGHIWGGGGGGGGGGVSADLGSSGNIAAGGGGGGGAGGGKGGTGFPAGSAAGSVSPAQGAGGSSGPAGTFGTSGAGAQTGSGTGGAGGAGGDWGAAGSAGTSPTADDIDVAAGAGGAAGLAVDQNGGIATFVSGDSAPNVKGSVT